jgi:outer membrane receptor for ferrienterochelin and colicins
MKNTFFPMGAMLLLALFGFGPVRAQSLTVRVEDSLTREPLAGVTLRLNTKPVSGAITDGSGSATFKKRPASGFTLTVSFLGYKDYELETATLPDTTLTIRLATAQAALDEVTVTATRTNFRIEDLPIKVEVLGQEDMDEESAVVPGNVASILGDISIIHIQRTSLANGNQGIRMQGLDPKYTQILRDGLPLYEGFSGNLGVLQIPPLDLKQVEVVKGPASTLYGGGAIGGLINLVSRKPGAEPALTAVLNYSNLREKNALFYASRQVNDRVGATLFAGYTDQPAFDVNSDGFSDAPLIRQFTLHPRAFLTLSDKNRLNAGYTLIAERRDGGFTAALDNPDLGTQLYVVKNTLQRHTLDASLDHEFRRGHTLTTRGTVSYFDRQQTDAGFRFNARQWSAYAEAADYLQRGPHTLVAGANLTTEAFRKGQTDGSPIRDFDYNTLGLFVQDDYVISKKITAQGGLRLDNHNVYGAFFLPRLSLLIKPSEALSVRTSIGTGYKTPNVFASLTANDARAQLRYRYLLALDASVRPERSLGLNMDIAYTAHIGEHLSIQLDQAFYYTTVQNPVVAVADLKSSFFSAPTLLQNAPYDLRSLGTDTYLRLEYKAIEFYLGYNHTIAERAGTGQATFIPFSPQDKGSLTLAYSVEEKWRAGIEASLVANQYIYDNQRVPNYTFWALAVERMLGHVSLVLNAENLFNIRQANYGPIISGSPADPSVAPLWGPQEGRIVNLALKYRLN